MRTAFVLICTILASLARADPKPEEVQGLLTECISTRQEVAEHGLGKQDVSDPAAKFTVDDGGVPLTGKVSNSFCSCTVYHFLEWNPSAEEMERLADDNSREAQHTREIALGCKADLKSRGLIP